MNYKKYIGKSKFVDFLFRRAVTASIFLKLKPENKKYYTIIHPHPAGFFSDFFYVLGHMVIADKYGLIPVVDMERYPSLYQDDPPYNGISNAWEQFFTQTIDAASDIYIYISENHVQCEEKYPYGIVPYYSSTNLAREGFPTKRKVRKLNRYIEKYISIRPELESTFEELAAQLKITDCIGLHIRGTDMQCTQGHPKPETLEKTFRRIEKLRQRHGFTHLFLCTDEDSICSAVKDHFAGTLTVLSSSAYRSSGGQQGLHLEDNPSVERPFHKYRLGLEVLQDVYLLSKCKALVCGRSNVAYAAIVLNNNHYTWIDCKANA